MTSEPTLPKTARARLAAMTALVVFAIVVSALLAWQAVASANQHRAAAQRALEDYAEFAAFVLATGVYRDFGLEVLALFNTMPPWRSVAARTFAPPKTCSTESFYFEYDPERRELWRNGGTLPEGVDTQLRDTLAYAATLLNEASWRFRLIRLDLGEGGNGVFIASTTIPTGFGIRGFSTCLWQDSTFVELMRRGPALPPSLIGDVPPDSLYAVSVGDPDGAELYVSSIWYPPTFEGTSRLGAEFGDLELKVTLNPAIAPNLVIGGLPPSRLPAALILFGLSAILLVAAVMQLRREYRLIAARSDFVSSVSHELRTPLSQILIFTELLKLNRLRSDAERSRSLDIIDKETRRLIRLVENVLQFSRASSPSEPIDDCLPLLPVVQETVDAFAPLAEAKHVAVDILVDASVRVRGNRNSFRQVLLNLLDNAVKYGPREQTIRIEAVTRGDEVEIAIEDQGPGIPVTERDNVWQGFRRLEREESSAVSGSGIGLSVVRSLVKRMEGTIRVVDSDTGGARFEIVLPAGRKSSLHA